MKTTVCCLLVQGHIKAFNADYVAALAKGVAAHMDRPYEFVCLTDQPKAVAHIARPIPIRALAGRNCWWSKLEVFNPAHQWDGRLLYFDLDTLVVGPLGPILDFPASLALIPDGAPNFHGKDGLTCVKKFNGSVMVTDGGAFPNIYKAWTPAVTKRLWSDQDLIAEMEPRAQAMPASWFPRLSSFQPLCADKAPSWPPDAKVILTKVPKNHIAAEQWPWFAQQWRATA